MRTIFLTLCLSVVTVVHAADFKIIETETGIYVEYTGTPENNGVETTSAAGGDTTEAPAALKQPAAVYEKPELKKIREITNQMEKLKQEADETLKVSGGETAEEMRQKEAAASEKRLRIEKYADEIQQLTGNRPNLNLLYNSTSKARGRRGASPMPSPSSGSLQ